MTLPICAGCSKLGCSLGDERFCAACLRLIAAATDIGVDLFYEYLGKRDAFETYLRETGRAA